MAIKKAAKVILPAEPGEYLCSEFWNGEWKPFQKVDVYWKEMVVDDEGRTRFDLVFQSSWSEYIKVVYFSVWKTI